MRAIRRHRFEGDSGSIIIERINRIVRVKGKVFFYVITQGHVIQ